jgi:hypothetical protein
MASYSYNTKVYCKGELETLEDFKRQFRMALCQDDYDEDVYSDELIEPRDFDDGMISEGVYKAEFYMEEVRVVPFVDNGFPDLFDWRLSFFIFIEKMDNSLDLTKSSFCYIFNDDGMEQFNDSITVDEASLGDNTEAAHEKAVKTLDKWRDKNVTPKLNLWLLDSSNKESDDVNDRIGCSKNDFYGTWITSDGSTFILFEKTFENKWPGGHYTASIESWQPEKNNEKTKKKFEAGFKFTMKVTEVFEGSLTVGMTLCFPLYINAEKTAIIDDESAIAKKCIRNGA